MTKMIGAIRILPVIHLARNALGGLAQVEIARACGADGVFLISHHGEDRLVLECAEAAIRKHPGFMVGVNLLSTPRGAAASQCLLRNIRALWVDNAGVSSAGLDSTGRLLKQHAEAGPLQVFASVAFKYQAAEPDPARAARNAIDAGFLPTTSGPGTGVAPDVRKIAVMSDAIRGQLAVASGMTPENVHLFAPYLSHILVSAGVSRSEHELDPPKLRRLIEAARASRNVARSTC